MSHIVGQTKEDCEREYNEQFPEFEYDPVLGDTYGYPKIELMNKGWLRFCVGWALLGLWDDEPAMYFDYYLKEDEWFINLDYYYNEAYIFKDKIAFSFHYYPYYEEYPFSEET